MYAYKRNSLVLCICLNSTSCSHVVAYFTNIVELQNSHNSANVDSEMTFSILIA